MRLGTQIAKILESAGLDAPDASARGPNIRWHFARLGAKRQEAGRCFPSLAARRVVEPFRGWLPGGCARNSTQIQAAPHRLRLGPGNRRNHEQRRLAAQPGGEMVAQRCGLRIGRHFAGQPSPCLRKNRPLNQSGGPRVPERQTPGPDGARAARLHRHNATLETRDKAPQRAPPHPTSQNNPARSVQTSKAARVLAKIIPTITMSIGPFLSLSKQPRS
jgi:hypothetical protein